MQTNKKYNINYFLFLLFYNKILEKSFNQLKFRSFKSHDFEIWCEAITKVGACGKVYINELV